MDGDGAETENADPIPLQNVNSAILKKVFVLIFFVY